MAESTDAVTGAIHPVASLAPAAPFSAMERGRVLGLCVRLTGDPDAAEDLAQETLFEAWRSEHRLRDPSKRWAWLAGIARNVCRRWARSRGREVARTARLAPAAGTSADGEPDHHVAGPAEELADERFDVEVEFERSELTVILDRAMALLPAATRELLVARVVEDKPPRELAERLGVGEGVVAVRLQRAKGRLRRMLTTGLVREAIAHGLVDLRGAWQETRIWCPACGRRRMVGRFAPDRHTLQVQCADPACGHVAAHHIELGTFDAKHPGLFAGAKGYKPALTRTLRHTHGLHRLLTRAPAPRCAGCGEPWHTRLDAAGLSVVARCPSCGWLWKDDAVHLAHALPEAQRFWREHPRMRTLPPLPAQYTGRPAAVVTLESASGAARLDVVIARDTLACLSIAGRPHVGHTGDDSDPASGA